MDNRSLMRFGAWAGILLAITSWAAVVVYFVIVPAAQKLPIADANAFLTSLASGSTGTQLYYGLYGLIAVWAFIGIVAMYFRMRDQSEAWVSFVSLLAGIAAVLTIVNGLQQLAFFRYLAALFPTQPQMALGLLNMPAPLNPVNLITQGLTAPWFLIMGILMLRADFPKLLAYLGFVAFADLAVGFFASLFGVDSIALLTAVIAGGVGGPVFWLWLGLVLQREPVAQDVKRAGPRMVVAK